MSPTLRFMDIIFAALVDFLDCHVVFGVASRSESGTLSVLFRLATAPPPHARSATSTHKELHSSTSARHPNKYDLLVSRTWM